MIRGPINPKQYDAFRVGPLPVDVINRALGTDLEPGDVWVSKACHKHMAEDHAVEYPIIRAAIEDLVTAPLYVGQDPKHAERFYVVRRIEPVGEKTHGLVAIGFERNQFGTYNVKSAYGIKQETVDSRRQAGRLKQVF